MRGFTLLEVLVALAVVSMAMLAVLGSAGQSTRTVIGLRDRTFAEWVAENQFTQMRLADTWPSIGDSDGDAELAGVQWHWKAHVMKTADPDLRRVEVSVAHKDTPDDSVETLVGFIGSTMPPKLPTGTDGNTPSSGSGTSGDTTNSGGPKQSSGAPNNRSGGGR